MLGWRLFISAILIPALCGIFYLDARLGESAPILLMLCLLLAVRAAWELTDLLRARSLEPSFAATALCCAGVVLAGFSGTWVVAGGHVDALAAVSTAYSLVVLLLFLKGAVTFREPGRSMATLGAELLVVSYIGVLLAVTAQLRWVAGADAGYLVLGSLIAAAKMGDIGAYTSGRLFGRRKMAPKLSPGKTWAGAVGALCGGALGGWLWLTFATPLFDSNWIPPAWYWSVGYGVTIGLVGLLGDLCESLIKRDAERKDSAPLMPGFGGLLDLLDSILYAGPVAYVLWKTLPLAAGLS